MPRPIKCRCIEGDFVYRMFKPQGIPQSNLKKVNVSIDELEALRLADYEGLYQEECAKRMNISRQTFGNIISSVRAKIADFLINGKVLIIEGGEVNIASRRFLCRDCNSEFAIDVGSGFPDICPKCGKNGHIERHPMDRGEHGRCRHGNQNKNRKYNGINKNANNKDEE